MQTWRVDDLFKKYLSEVPILPDDTKLWGFTLPNYFWTALTKEMQTRITDEKLYTHPDMSTLVTKTAQLNELRKLREDNSVLVRTPIPGSSLHNLLLVPM